MIPNSGVVLVDAVVVDEDAGGANVGFFPDGCITNVGEVRNFRAAADLGVLRFDESAEFALFAELGAGADVGVGADGGVFTDDGQ